MYDNEKVKPKKQDKYVYAVRGNYGRGYEDVTGEETFEEAKQTLKDYRDNEPGTPFKIEKVKESIFNER